MDRVGSYECPFMLANMTLELEDLKLSCLVPLTF